MTQSVFTRTYLALMETDPSEKCRLVKQLREDFAGAKLSQDSIPVEIINVPGRPAKPRLVQPRDLVKRKIHTEEGRAALLHAIAHIEFNAINLALDAVYRFQSMPVEYLSDWLKVAHEEAYHFTLVADYLRDLGYPYGSFPAHNGLWEMAKKTTADVMVRMALVPRILEARGLDVTPGIMEKFRSIGDHRSIEILEIIQTDEIGHVRIGNHWFRFCCQQKHLEPLVVFKELLDRYAVNQIRKPILHAPRLKAGFSQDDLAHLESIAV